MLLNIFTNRKNCDIIIMPNNLNIHSYRSFSRYGITITFFAIQLSKLVLVKTLLLLDCIENLCYEEIVWRQLELAFFGALTSVGALFVFLNEKSIAPLLRHNLFGKKSINPHQSVDRNIGLEKTGHSTRFFFVL